VIGATHLLWHYGALVLDKTRCRARWELDGVRGVVVAIDVLRALASAAYAFAAGASSILLVAGVEEAIELGRSIPGALIMGEDHGRRPHGFDLSNSPVAVSRAEIAGRVIVQRTSAGTQGVIAATDADRVFAASLVCASATAKAIDACGLGPPSYVITGRFPDSLEGGEDDLISAQFIEDLRVGNAVDADVTSSAIASTAEATRTLALGGDDVHADDVAFATAVDLFDFAMEAVRDGMRVRLIQS
jgi:2-phosphosulfolactate phosphatase